MWLTTVIFGEASIPAKCLNSDVAELFNAIYRRGQAGPDAVCQKTSSPVKQACGNSGNDTRIVHRSEVLYGHTCCIYVCRLHEQPWGGTQRLLRNKGIAPCLSSPYPPLNSEDDSQARVSFLRRGRSGVLLDYVFTFDCQRCEWPDCVAGSTIWVQLPVVALRTTNE
jgi:hypothetical protein